MGGGLETYALEYGTVLAVLSTVTAADSVMRLICLDFLWNQKLVKGNLCKQV